MIVDHVHIYGPWVKCEGEEVARCTDVNCEAVKVRPLQP